MHMRKTTFNACILLQKPTEKFNNYAQTVFFCGNRTTVQAIWLVGERITRSKKQKYAYLKIN